MTGGADVAPATIPSSVMMDQHNNESSSVMVMAASPLPDSEHHTFSLVDMVPDFEKITIDDSYISVETEELVIRATSCDKTDPNTHSSNFESTTRHQESKIDDPTDAADSCPPCRRVFHPLKSSLKRSSTSSSTCKMDESSNTCATAMDESSTSRSSRRKSVGFSNLEIRSYGVTLGNCPTLHGPPITLDWSYDDSETERYKVDAYEHYRHARRSRSELVIPPSHREYCLMQSGFSRSQIKLAMEDAKRAAKEREKTVRSATRRFSLQDIRSKTRLLPKIGVLRRSSADV